MPYDELVARLEDDFETVRVGAFPDGSVDDYYRVRDGASTVTSRAAFAAAIAEGRDAFGLDHVMTDAGGQSVNAARQAAALGDDVLLAGHLNHPIFAFDFQTVSMGEPARVRVCLFDADDVMLVEESTDLGAWTFDDLRAALAGSVDDFLERDVLCCTNWASVSGLASAMSAIAARDPDGGVFCIDPGPLTMEQARNLLAAVEPLSTVYDVVLSVNETEVSRLAAAAGYDEVDDPADDADAVEGVRSTAGVSGVAVHAAEVAVAATTEGTVSVPNIHTERMLTETGAGDRFSAGLARTLAAGWGWNVALAAGNACASYYVSEGDTAGRDALREHVATHDPL